MDVKRNRFATYVWIVLAYTILVILWGALVRATGSGAGCGSHWPTCNGTIIPRPEAVETLIEFSHRVSSGLAGFWVLIMLGWAWRLYPKGHVVRKATAVTLFFMLLEGAIGAMLVRLELVGDNNSTARAVMIAVHLVNTFLLLAALTLTGWWAKGGQRLRLRGQGRHGWFVLLGALGFLLLGASGAITALGDTLFPVASLAEGLRQDFDASAHFLIELRVYHPLIGVILGVYLIVAGSIIQADVPATRPFVRWLKWLFAAQLVVGVVNVLLLAPVWMQLLHLAMADMVWISAILLAAATLSAPTAVSETAVAPVPQVGD